jgi:hypothetical protein
MQLKLVSSEAGKYGAIRTYRHDRLGGVATLTLWRDPGAHVIHVRRPTTTPTHQAKEIERQDRSDERTSFCTRTRGRARARHGS